MNQDLNFFGLDSLFGTPLLHKQQQYTLQVAVTTDNIEYVVDLPYVYLSLNNAEQACSVFQTFTPSEFEKVLPQLRNYRGSHRLQVNVITQESANTW